MPKPIQACPICGDTDLRMPGMAMEGIIVGDMPMKGLVCRTKEHHAVPLEFDEREAYEAWKSTLPDSSG